ncbi:TIGR02594 family protein [Xanthobacter sp. VTT E-85241]|uniref:TIGR02594 family protein n=1 Tax=Roseixanthobacter finlandensis TaxID=3119922 RepID=UPI0037279F88
MADPVWLANARALLGTKETPGSGNTAAIMGWAKRLGGWIAGYFTGDAIPWCGLFVAHVMTLSGFRDIPKNPLGALQWSDFGSALRNGAPGAILTFRRPGGGHVGFYVGEDADCFHVLGGNQSDAVTVTRVEKSRLDAIRWPNGGGTPGARVMLTRTGAPSRNEA